MAIKAKMAAAAKKTRATTTRAKANEPALTWKASGKRPRRRWRLYVDGRRTALEVRHCGRRREPFPYSIHVGEVMVTQNAGTGFAKLADAQNAASQVYAPAAAKPTRED